jgi:hypothetical protein
LSDEDEGDTDEGGDGAFCLGGGRILRWRRRVAGERGGADDTDAEHADAEREPLRAGELALEEDDGEDADPAVLTVEEEMSAQSGE